MFVQYDHFGRIVTTFEAIKGQYKKICLCYHCDLFKPSTPDNCKIAQDTYENCVKHGLVTPVVECPQFKERQST